MQHMPRLHPEDLAELGKIISEELKPVMQQAHSKESAMKENMTFSIKEAAKILGKHPQTINDWCKKGIIKAAKSGNEWRITQQTLNDHIHGNTK